MSSATTCYADRAWHGTVAVEINEPIAKDTYRIRFACPAIARAIVPGQFLMLRLAGCNDPLLGRPLALYDVVTDAAGQPWGVDIVYLAIGKMTRLLPEIRPGSPLEVWGPLGNGFPATPTEHLLMVAGGIGQTPFLALAREYLGLYAYGDPPRSLPRAKRVSLCYGARSGDYLAGVADFSRLGIHVKLSTDDGSMGHHGRVTELIEPILEQHGRNCRIVCCGPESMMKATQELARRLGLSAQFSLETPMACGIGVCFSCVAKIRDASGGWDYRRTCVEGPVFDGADIDFE
ncbi:MAG: dihydroorotate dehydrogenase electron transfer subunit [Planctomycetota bacterium]